MSGTVEDVWTEFKKKRDREFSREELERLREEARSLADYERLWRCACRIEHDSYHVTWTPKERAQINLLSRDLPRGKFGEFLVDVIRDWTAFTQATVSGAGAYKPPGSPHVGFLLRYRDAAVGWFLEGKELEAIKGPSLRGSGPR